MSSGTLVDSQLVLREQSPWQALLGVDGSGTDARIRYPTASVPETPTGPQTLPIGGTLRADGQVISLEVARTPVEQETGLMFRTELAPDRGMAFVLPGSPMRSRSG